MGKAEATSRALPVLRKEVIETETWGELCICQLLASAKVALLAVNDNRDAPPGETELQAKARRFSNQALFYAGLLARSVVDPKTQLPVYTAEQWDAWSATHDVECLKVIDKACELNGFHKLSGEDVSKNV